MTDDPFMYVWALCKAAKTPGYRYLTKLLEDPDPINTDLTARQERLLTSERSKLITYCTINPLLEVAPLYSTNVPEHYRIPTSRVRLSSHNLAIETGRWSRIPRDRRLCGCGEIQTEEHFLCHCRDTEQYRVKHRISDKTLSELFATNDPCKVARFIFDCMQNL